MGRRFLKDGAWHAIGGLKNHPPKHLAVGERIVCFASADDWLNLNETDETAHKTRSWFISPPPRSSFNIFPAIATTTT